jgi:hypothetical protein
MSKTLTNEGSIQYDSSLSHEIEFFSKAGSLYKTKTKQPYYGNETTALKLFKDVWASGNHEVAMKLVMWLRDVRGGAGNRSGFRDCIKWLVETEPKWVEANIGLIPEHGRWDDVRVLFETPLDNAAAKLWGDAIINKNVLAAKWADRNDKSILRYFRGKKVLKDIGEFRRLLAKVRKAHIVESKMCEKNWKEIEYPHVPSVAMSRYTKAFNKNDESRFSAYKEALAKGEAKINASALFPHDLVRTIHGGGDYKIANEQFKALPNYLEGTKQRIICICDSSGSMSSIIGGTVRAVDVSTSLSLYCSDRIGKENPFYRKFIQFESESKLTDWADYTFASAYGYGDVFKKKEIDYFGYGRQGLFNGACGGTRIDKALDMILTSAKMFNATKDQIPNVLLILSYMQFHGVPEGTAGKTVVEHCLDKWETAGYDRPKIVYWNLAGYAGSPATISHNNVGLVSGFSPAILKAVFGGEDFSPRGIMLRAIEKYKIVTPQ